MPPSGDNHAAGCGRPLVLSCLHALFAGGWASRATECTVNSLDQESGQAPWGPSSSSIHTEAVLLSCLHALFAGGWASRATECTVTSDSFRSRGRPPGDRARQVSTRKLSYCLVFLPSLLESGRVDNRCPAGAIRSWQNVDNVDQGCRVSADTAIAYGWARRITMEPANTRDSNATRRGPEKLPSATRAAARR